MKTNFSAVIVGKQNVFMKKARPIDERSFLIEDFNEVYDQQYSM